jgi:hypothetical protein
MQNLSLRKNEDKPESVLRKQKLEPRDNEYYVKLMNKINQVRFEVSTAVTMMIIIFWEMIIIKINQVCVFKTTCNKQFDKRFRVPVRDEEGSI